MAYLVPKGKNKNKGGGAGAEGRGGDGGGRADGEDHKDIPSAAPNLKPMMMKKTLREIGGEDSMGGERSRDGEGFRIQI